MKIIGFDYDGTLTNIEPEKAAAFGDTVAEEWGSKKNEASSFWLNKGGTSRKFKFEYFYTQRFNQELPDEVYEKIEKKFSQLLRDKYYPNIELLDHVLDILKFTRSKFDFMFVSSGIPANEIEYLIEQNKISKYFDKVLGTNSKYLTKKDHFDEIREQKKPSLFVFVGDSEEDMRKAKEGGLIAVGLTTNHPAEKLKAAGADYACGLEECEFVISEILKTVTD